MADLPLKSYYIFCTRIIVKYQLNAMLASIDARDEDGNCIIIVNLLGNRYNEV